MKTAVKTIVATVILGALAGGAWALAPRLVPAPPENVVAATRDAVAKIDSARFDITMEMSADGRKMALEGQGAFMLPMALELTGTMTAAGSSPLVFEERLVDGTLYIRSGDDQQWYALEGAVSSAGLDAQSLGASNPEQYFAYFDAFENIEDFGTQKIRGVECRHLLLEIDEARLAELIAGGSQDDDAAVNEMIASTTFQVEIWVGVEDGLPYREVIDMQSSGATVMSGTTQLDFTAFDTNPTITAPSGAKPFPVESR